MRPRAREEPQIYELEEFQCDTMLQLLKDYMSFTCQLAGSCSHGMPTHNALYDGLRDLASVLLPLVQCREGSPTWTGMDTIWHYYVPQGSGRHQWVPPGHRLWTSRSSVL